MVAHSHDNLEKGPRDDDDEGEEEENHGPVHFASLTKAGQVVLRPLAQSHEHEELLTQQRLGVMCTLIRELQMCKAARETHREHGTGECGEVDFAAGRKEIDSDDGVDECD